MKELFEIQQRLRSSKDCYNEFGNFNYRNLENILSDLKPLLREYNCTITFNDEIVNVGNYNYIQSTATLTNSEGKTYSTKAFAREDETRAGMSAGQLTGCGSSYSRKYALCGLCAINEEKDLDALDNGTKKAHKPAPKQVINEDLEWKPEGNFVSKVEMTKTLTPAEELKNWYETTTHTETTDRFFKYWYNRLTTNGWSGKFDLNSLIQKYCK